MGTEIKKELHLSHSQVTEFMRCPRKYHLHYRLGLPAEFCPSGLLLRPPLLEVSTPRERQADIPVLALSWEPPFRHRLGRLLSSSASADVRALRTGCAPTGLPTSTVKGKKPYSLPFAPAPTR